MSMQETEPSADHSPVFEFKARNMLSAGFIAALFIYGIIGASKPEVFWILSNTDLILHEMGHLVIGIFGIEVLTVLGGTIGQLFFPIAFAVYFIRRRQYYNSSVMVFWIVQNLFDIAIYMADARALKLPLFSFGSGDGGIDHDWNYLLYRWGILVYDTQIAGGIKIIGYMLFVVFLLSGLFFALQSYKTDDTEAVEFIEN